MAHILVPAALAGVAYVLGASAPKRRDTVFDVEESGAFVITPEWSEGYEVTPGAEGYYEPPSLAYSVTPGATEEEIEAAAYEMATLPTGAEGPGAIVLETPVLDITEGPIYTEAPEYEDAAVATRIETQAAAVKDAVERVKVFYEEQKLSENTSIQRILDIVRGFIRDRELVLYGGTAINALLPPEDQFYDYSKELPDYDFYSSNAREHAKQLADLLFAAGFEDAQARSGLHEGTYKVSADFQMVADITQLPPEALAQIDVVELPDGLLYAGPMWLRIDMYKQLSEIKGQQDRWPKVWQRLQLLNKNYPLGATECPEQYCAQEGEQCERYGLPMRAIAQSIVDYGRRKQLVFVGGMSRHVFRALDKTGAEDEDIGALVQSYGCLQDRVCLMDVLSLKPFADAEAMANELRAIVPGSVVTLQPAPDAPELFSERFLISIDGRPMVEIMRPDKCFGYVTLDGYRIGTLDTVITIMFAKLFVDAAQIVDATKAKYICMLEFLMKLVQERGNMSGEGPFARFPIDCYGEQRTLLDTFRDRWQDRIDRLILEWKGVRTPIPTLMYRPMDYELVREGEIDPKYVGHQVKPLRERKRPYGRRATQS